MSEAELHFIRARLQGGILSKARRGELHMPLPVGLVYDPAGKVVLDPDTSVQNALHHVFQTFARTGSARAVVYEFTREGLLFPTRIRKGHRTGELAWSELEHWRVLRTLHNPRYAGAFAYGRRRNRKTPDGKMTSHRLPREEWTALIPDTHPGYLTWEQFEQNLRTLAENARAHGQDRAGGPAREGPALLQGLVICGRCGNRMSVHYHQRRGALVPDYRCIRENIQQHAPQCQTIPGQRVDETISQLLLETVTPLALEVALTVQAELEARADEADQLRRGHVERARHHAELARRRYLAVDPDNRLVADTLEADWNDKLRALQAAQDDYDRDTAAAHAQLTEQHKSSLAPAAAGHITGPGTEQPQQEAPRDRPRPVRARGRRPAAARDPPARTRPPRRGVDPGHRPGSLTDPVGSARAGVVECFPIHDRRINIEPYIDPGRATRAHRDALLVVSHPADDLVPQRPRPLGNAPENLGALERSGQFGKLLILWDPSMAGGDRPITGTDRDHPHLVRTCLRPDLRPPLLRIDALRRADPATAQQLRIIAARSLEIVVGDPPKALVVLRRHAESRSSPDTESEPTPTAR